MRIYALAQGNIVINLPRILLGLMLSTAIGAIAYRRRSLTRSGWLGAIVTGTATFGFGGWAWGLTLIFFFISSSVLSHFKQRQKQQIAGEKFEKGGQRDFAQAMANGGAGAALALIYGLSGEPPALLLCYAGVMATVTADTWATELGVLARGRPLKLTTLRPAEPGTSGAVSIVGTLAGAVGALLIGGCLTILVGIEQGNWLLSLIPAALVGGVIGSLTDSLLGATVQVLYSDTNGGETERPIATNGTPNSFARGWHWMTNDMVNILSSIGGGLIALICGSLLRGF